jgi:hypothetical protein
MTQARKAQTEDRCLDILNFLVSRLSRLTDGPVDIGGYWIFNGSIGARVRAKRPFPGIDSDYWEAAVCLTSDETSVWSDIMLFPFLRNSPVTRRGRIADEGNEAEVDEFWWLQFENDEWQHRGWSYPDGPGEWAWITKPGDEFRYNLDCQPVNPVVSEDVPLLIDITNIGKHPHQHINPDSDIIRLSLVHVHRGHEGMNLSPWGEHLPKTKSPYVVPLRWSKDVRQNQCRIDLRKWSIRGGWMPGKYYLTVRAQFTAEESGNWTSVISSPIRLQIVE